MCYFRIFLQGDTICFKTRMKLCFLLREDKTFSELFHHFLFMESWTLILGIALLNCLSYNFQTWISKVVCIFTINSESTYVCFRLDLPLSTSPHCVSYTIQLYVVHDFQTQSSNVSFLFITMVIPKHVYFVAPGLYYVLFRDAYSCSCVPHTFQFSSQWNQN